MTQRSGLDAKKALRATRQRKAVLEALERAEGFRTAQELYDDLRALGVGVGLTTVYRTLQLLADAAQVDVLRNETGEAMYRNCDAEGHHHHLVCDSCGVSVEIESAAVERWAQQVARRHGFTHTNHTAEVYGMCSACAAR